MFSPFIWGFDPTIVILIPSIIFTLYAQARVRSNFSKYLIVRSIRGYTGYQVARTLLDRHGLRDVSIEIVRWHLGDHYDPRNRVLRLSKEVYEGSSIASISVAAHEVGHAIQHANGYVPLKLRNLIYPVASFGSSAAWFFIIIGLLIPELGGFMDLGIILFGAAVFFQIITLPVEFNASRRALNLMMDNGFIMHEEIHSSKKVLRAAALTYVAAMAIAIAQLFRLLLIRNTRRR